MVANSAWANINDLILMQDGAPPHFALDVRDWLDRRVSGRWLGRRGPHEWPARSPDLTPVENIPHRLQTLVQNAGAYVKF
jgi:hypothetical protein